jgi:hypothetical protein
MDICSRLWLSRLWLSRLWLSAFMGRCNRGWAVAGRAPYTNRDGPRVVLRGAHRLEAPHHLWTSRRQMVIEAA